MPRTSRLAVGGPAGETTDFDADYKFSPLERMLLYLQLLSVQRCQPPPQAERSCWGGVPDPPSSRAHGPSLPPLRRRPPSTLGSCVSVRSRRLCS